MTQHAFESISAAAGLVLLLDGKQILDVRSEGEYLYAGAPGLINLPILSDAERHAVGTCYRHDGPASAIALGENLVRGELRNTRIRGWTDCIARDNVGALTCSRGGLRSKITQQWIAGQGVELPRVSGGYKSLRNVLMSECSRALSELKVLVAAGKTGSGKTEILQALPEVSLDLEKHAQHCGSAFGDLLGSQPSQSTFENRVCMDLARLRRRSALIVIEDESAKIGKVSIVADLRQRIATAPCFVVERPFDERVNCIRRDYVERFLDPSDGLETCMRLEEFLRRSLAKVSKRLGAGRTAECAALMDAALEAQRQGKGTGNHDDWIAFLLREYYDPKYEHGLTLREGTILFYGSPEETCERVRSLDADIPARSSN